MQGWLSFLKNNILKLVSALKMGSKYHHSERSRNAVENAEYSASGGELQFSGSHSNPLGCSMLLS